MSATPPITSNRRALNAENDAAISPPGVAFSASEWSDITIVFRAAVRSPELRDHVFGEKFLRLDALPMLQAAEIRDDRQLCDSTFGLQRFYLRDYFLRRADEPDFLISDFVVRQFR